MGYYVTLEQSINIRSPLTLTELQEKLLDSELAGDFTVSLEEGSHPPYFLIEPAGGDYYGKFTSAGNKVLEKFVSSVIAPDDYQVIEWTGEDGAKWGIENHKKSLQTGGDQIVEGAHK